MGIGSQTTGNIASRFASDAISLFPKLVIIDGGVNDIAGSVSTSTVVANYTTMLNSCQSNSVICGVLLILPWSNGTTSQMNTRDELNTLITNLVASYTTSSFIIDAGSYVGSYRSGGPDGNLWNIKTGNGDGSGVHFNSTGHTNIAQAIFDAVNVNINLTSPSGWNGGNVSVNYLLKYADNVSSLNLSNSSTTGIEYSTDGNSWFDATLASSSPGVTNLSGSPGGVLNSFVWDTASDLPNMATTTAYLRLRGSDGTIYGAAWTTSSVFYIDNVAPETAATPTFSNVSTSSLDILMPTSSDIGSGLNTWQVRRNGSVILSSNSTTTQSVTDSALSPNTMYFYDVAFSDVRSNTSTYSVSGTIYTLANTPNSLTVSGRSRSELSFEWEGDATDYWIENITNSVNSGWITSTNYTFGGLSCGTSYDLRLKGRNYSGIETDFVTSSFSTNNCSSGSGSYFVLSSPVATFPSSTINLPSSTTDFSTSSIASTTSDVVATSAKFVVPISYLVRNLSIGMSDSSVLVLQKFLNDNGYFVSFVGPGTAGKETTYFGSATQSALKKFQSDNGFSNENGALGNSTRNFINGLLKNKKISTSCFSAKKLKFGMKDPEVKEIQKFLAEQGFLKGDIITTENYGRLTRQAVVDFQLFYKNNILEPLGLKSPTGIWGVATAQKANQIRGCLAK